MITFRFAISFFFFLVLLLLPASVFAETTSYRSAGWVATETFPPAYTNLSNCQATDGTYCSRLSGSGGNNLYFSSFGTLNDFGIPQNASITKVHIKITGKNNDYQRIYLDRGKNKNPLSQLCNNPFDLWSFYLGFTNITKEFHTTFTPFSTGGNNLGQCFTTETIDAQNYTFSVYDVESYPWSADIDNFEIGFDYTPAPTPTQTNTPTPTPSPSATPTPTAEPTPAPFLDLPWDYTDFDKSALTINSYFDHTYPLLSSGLAEPSDFLKQITTYKNEISKEKSYSLHDGYDYGKRANVNIGDSVLAAAGGFATYHYSSAGGNMIFIDHGNYYQTRYLHMQPDGLITKSSTIPLWVNSRQVIGKVGATGHIIPSGDAGAHIHFGVFEDKNKDGNFDDNIPDGATDPFGWQSTDPDPWAQYSFFYNGQQRTGNKSYYLWLQKIPGLKAGLPANGGIFHVGKSTITFPDDQARPNLTVAMQSAPYAKVSDSLVGIMPSLEIVAKNLLGDLVKLFAGSITIKIDFHDVDLSHYDLGTTMFAIYSTDDGTHWTKEPTVIDLTDKTATTQVNHLTTFALMAQRLDTIAPTTEASLQGDQGQTTWFRSDVSVSLNAHDNDGGLGVDYILYKKDDDDWQTYTTPLVFTTEGHHIVQFYSGDNDGNSEDVKASEFTIDKTKPEAEIRYDLTKFDTTVLGKDSSGAATVVETNANSLHPKFVVSDVAGNLLTITTDKIKIGKQVALSIKNLQYNSDSVISIENNVFFTLAITDKNNAVKQLDQYYMLKDDKKIFTNYVSSTNMTKIYTKTSGVTGYTQENKPGIILLKLFTQTGTLKYSY